MEGGGEGWVVWWDGGVYLYDASEHFPLAWGDLLWHSVLCLVPRVLRFVVLAFTVLHPAGAHRVGPHMGGLEQGG